MLTGRTLTGKRFTYSGSLATGLTVLFENCGAATRIPVRIINIIRHEITKRSPVLMGANRNPLVADSVGENLWLKHKTSPHALSYVLPLQIEEGFCTVSDRKPFVIQRSR